MLTKQILAKIGIGAFYRYMYPYPLRSHSPEIHGPFKTYERALGPYGIRMYFSSIVIKYHRYKPSEARIYPEDEKIGY